MKVGAAILAGGMSMRLGGISKALLQIGNQRIIDRQVSVLKEFFDEIILISPQPLPSIQLPHVPDLLPGLGPMGGIYTALRHTNHSACLIISCDLPFISSELTELLIHKYHKHPVDALVPLHTTWVEPLFAIYHKNCLPALSKQIEQKQLAIKDVFKEVNTQYVPVPETCLSRHCFFNVNHGSDIEQAKVCAADYDKPEITP